MNLHSLILSNLYRGDTRVLRRLENTDDNTALAVINDLQLEKYRPFAFHPSIIGWIDGNNARIKAEQGLPLSQAPARRARLLKIFGNKLKVDNPPDTRLITVAYDRRVKSKWTILFKL